jgi:D-tyrosyl-tRNA(Tyr) deacylase
MRAVVQRVSRASVRVDDATVGAIERGLCVLVGVMDGDVASDVASLAKKTAQLRIFEDESDKMNLSVGDIGGAVLAVSQFTLAGDVRKGNRPSFMAAMEPGAAKGFFDDYCEALRGHGITVETGTFRAHMEVELVGDGPVTILLDTRRAF